MHADITPGLILVGLVGPLFNDELWLPTHPDIRKSGRIYAFVTHCVEAIRKRRDLIEGLWGTTLGPADVAEITAASLLLPTA